MYMARGVLTDKSGGPKTIGLEYYTSAFGLTPIPAASAKSFLYFAPPTSLPLFLKVLKFDTDEEAVEFTELHGFETSTWVPPNRPPVTQPYLLLNNKKKVVLSPRVPQAYSGKIVERKRTTQSCRMLSAKPSTKRGRAGPEFFGDLLEGEGLYV
ncbi:hypothetical protein QBC40DRAFT_287291 [Triangularia verruculosa]|uniref:Uncharacterized protein n=1 Tax=Triangularia verruculosa TaxID=2587418 RepID=A0AAN7AS16_9PEZI|nr:hypothetical protein QBC40DRAFT_287291 [Triangularia verruculosa]